MNRAKAECQQPETRAPEARAYLGRIRPKRNAHGPGTCLALALAACLLGACSGLLSRRPAGSASRYSDTAPREVVSAAVEVLESEGYVIADIDENTLLLIGQQLEIVTRPRGSFLKGTTVKTQVVIEVEAQGPGTEVRATFNIAFRRPTGERRTWTSETSPCLRLRDRFYRNLGEALGIELAEVQS